MYLKIIATITLKDVQTLIKMFNTVKIHLQELSPVKAPSKEAQSGTEPNWAY